MPAVVMMTASSPLRALALAQTEVRHSGLDHRETDRQTDRQDRGLRDWRNAQPTARGWGGQTCRDACNGDGDSPEARTSPLKPGIICAIAFLGASLTASASKASGVANMLKDRELGVREGLLLLPSRRLNLSRRPPPPKLRPSVVRKLVMPMHAKGSGAANPTIREHSLAIEFVWYHKKA
ncbi:hypothetical protein FA13DRAFT_1713839 [Coprinellus micaceus]|uniref:Uncharacterized protein n=1 Tax=Coprinellus micaceus TaxID=71717 RepID=A0A4Y7SWH4_COPMI|nr:hypothetical protein FA13DRAFT_1713839 [Coprinellus micaceus]